MRISVITPTLDEAANLPLRARELAEQAGPWEWIVADGGSADASVAVARAAGAVVVRSMRGRGPQLNAGATHAAGDVFVILHADTALPPGALARVREALRDPRVAGGNFTLAFDDAAFAGRTLALAYALQGRFGMWYGDSVMFVRAETFRALGGFAPFPILEDAEFVERLRRAGRTLRLSAVVTTSARRYRGRLVQTLARWITIFALYKLGVSPHRLACLYAPHGRRSARSRRDEGIRLHGER